MEPYEAANEPAGVVSRRVAIHSGLLAISGLLAACAGGSGETESTAGRTSGTAGRAPGTTGTTPGATGASTGGSVAAATADQMTDATLTAAIGSDVGSMDPQSVGGTGGGNWPNYNAHFAGYVNELVRTNPETNEKMPALAESWELSDDHLTWTVVLRPNVKFHNGATMTAEDVKFSMDRVLGKAEYNPDFESGYGSQYAGIVDHVEVVDERTVKFVLTTPDVVFLSRPNFIIPKAAVEEMGDEEFARSPIGTGPFKFVSRVPDSEIRSERFDDYFESFGSPSGGHPSFVKTLVQKVIPEDQARLAALQAGEVDLIHNVSADIAKQLDGDDQFEVFYLNGSQPMQVLFNTAMETDPASGGPNPWRDKRVREAANHAVDVDTIISTILTGREARCFGCSSLGLGFPSDLPSKAWAYDPDKARELLDEAGFGGGIETTLYGPIGRWPNSRPVMEAVAQFLSEVGINCGVQEMQYQEYITKVQDNSLGPLVFIGITGGPDPGPNFRNGYFSTANYGLGGPVDDGGEDQSAYIDDLIEQSEHEFDHEKRVALLEQIITDYYFTAKAIYLYEPVTVVAGRNGLSWTPWARDLYTPEYWNIRVD